MEPRFELVGVVGLVGGPELLSDAVELERDGIPPPGADVGEVTMAGENDGEGVDEGVGKLAPKVFRGWS